MYEGPVSIRSHDGLQSADPRFEFDYSTYVVGLSEVSIWQPREDHIQDPNNLPGILPQGFVRDVLVAREIGPCGGVNLALNAIKEALERGRLVRSPHLPVHNQRAVASFPGALFGISMEEWQQEADPRTTWVGPAHGESLQTSAAALDVANSIGAESVNVTCPLVKHTWDKISSAKLYMEGQQQSLDDLVVIFFGQEGHDEQVETRRVAEEMGIKNFVTIFPKEEVIDELINDHSELLAGKTLTFVGQTTNNDSLTEAAAQYMTIAVGERTDLDASIPNQLKYSAENVCKTVRHRLEAVRSAFNAYEDIDGARVPEAVIVVGSRDSKNTQSIAKEALEVAKTRAEAGSEVNLQTVIIVSSVTQLDRIKERFKGKNVLVCSGASVTNEDVQEVVDYLNPDAFGFYKVGPSNNSENSFYPIALEKNPHQATLRKNILEKNKGSEIAVEVRRLLNDYAVDGEFQLSDIWSMILAANTESCVKTALDIVEKLSPENGVNVPLLCLLAREASYAMNFYPLAYALAKKEGHYDLGLYDLSFSDSRAIIQYLKRHYDEDIVNEANDTMSALLHRAMFELWDYPHFIRQDEDLPKGTTRDVTLFFNNTGL